MSNLQSEREVMDPINEIWKRLEVLEMEGIGKSQNLPIAQSDWRSQQPYPRRNLQMESHSRSNLRNDVRPPYSSSGAVTYLLRLPERSTAKLPSRSFGQERR